MNKLLALSATLLLAGCVTAPLGPTVAVMPGPGKSPEQYNADASSCQQTAQTALSGPTQNAQGNAATTAAGWARHTTADTWPKPRLVSNAAFGGDAGACGRSR